MSEAFEKAKTEYYEEVELARKENRPVSEFIVGKFNGLSLARHIVWDVINGN